jgi:glycosyltransferase involved in cell wall biosynthesis
MRDQAEPVEVSLVVCTRDRGDRLPRCLEALRALRGARRWELVLVDNGSRDGTAATLEAFARAVAFPVVLVREPRPGLGRARNAGVAAARGAILVFTDDDCYPAPDFLDRMAEAFDDPAIGYAAGRILLHDPADYPITIRAAADPMRLHPGELVRTGIVQGANMAVRRVVYDAVGGFDPALGPGTPFCNDDVDMAARASAAGYAGGFFPAALVYHHHGRRQPAEVAALQAEYDRGRGAYYAKFILRPDTRRLYLRHWSRSAVGAVRQAALRRLWWEGVGAVRYCAARLTRQLT